MDLIKDFLPWALLVISWIAFGVIVPRVKKRRGQPDRDIWKSPVVTDLRAQLQAKEERYQEQMEFFVNFPEVIKTLTGAISVEQVTSAMSRGISSLLSPERIGIFLAQTETVLRLVDGMGFPEKERGKYEFSIQGSKLLPILKQRSVSAIADYTGAAESLEGLGLNPCLTSPIWYGGRLLGLLVISAPKMDRLFGIRIFAMLADMASVSLHAAGLVAEIRKQAERDALTGLPNRRSLMARVENEIERARAYQCKTTLVMVDVDNFKHYNDTNGHAAGDECLKRVAALLSKGLRRTDLAARYGGEEFTLLIQSADHEGGLRTADRICRAIAGAKLPHGEHQPLRCVSVSMGLATFPEDGSDVASLFKAADSALYLAKEAGRNRVVVYEDRGFELPACD